MERQMQVETSKHTPGPWHTPREIFRPMHSGFRADTFEAIGVGNGASHVALVSVTGCSSIWEADANARLIAAAPELLSSLETVLKMAADGDLTTVEINEARAIVAKAKGGEIEKVPEFTWSNRNRQPSGKWGVFYYCQGTGFETGNKVYYGKNEFHTEDSAIDAQRRWEARVNE